MVSTDTGAWPCASRFEEDSSTVGASGYVDWHRLERTAPWVRQQNGQYTTVYAFWLVDYGRATHDHGLALLKHEGRHPDWFVHGESTDHVLCAYAPPKSLISPNFNRVFDHQWRARPLLASVLLASSDAVYRRDDHLWWAAPDDLTRRGKTVLEKLNRLYERNAVLITFIEQATDETTEPRDPS